MQNKTVEIHIEQPSDTASTAFADLAMAASGFVVSKGRKHGRKSSSVDQAVDSYFGETAAVHNRRVLAAAIENGELPKVNDKGEETTIGALKWGVEYAGQKRADAYDAIRGMCNADERFRPSIDATNRLGTKIKSLLDSDLVKNMEIRVPDVKYFVQRYLTEVYLSSDGVSEYLNIDDLNPQTVEEQAAALDAIAAENAEIVDPAA